MESIKKVGDGIWEGFLWPYFAFRRLYFSIIDDIDKAKARNRIENENRVKDRYVKKHYCEIGEVTKAFERFKILDDDLGKIVGQKAALKVIREQMRSIMQKYFEFDFFKKKKTKERECKIKEIEEILKEQKANKKKIREEIKKFEQDFDYENSKYLGNGPGVTFMYFVGPAGTGKTETALSVVKSLCSNGKPAFIIDASTIFKNGGKFSNLFADIEIKRNRDTYFLHSDLYSYIKTVKRGVIIFNEIDKVLKRKDLADDLNECLRALKDNNYFVDRNGEKVDCSGFVFIFTSNEKIGKAQYDKTGSMTETYFDQSLRTRIRFVQFDNFDVDNYKEMIKRYCEDVKKKFCEIYEDFGISIVFDEQVFGSCARYIFSDSELNNRGARAIYDVLGDNLKSVLFCLIETLKNEKDLNDESKLKGKTFYVYFDEINKNFIVSENRICDREWQCVEKENCEKGGNEVKKDTEAKEREDEEEEGRDKNSLMWRIISSLFGF